MLSGKLIRMILSVLPFVTCISLIFIHGAVAQDAVISDEQITCAISKTKSAEIEVYQKIMINNPRGDSYAMLITEESDFVKLTKFHGKIYDAGGNIVAELDRKDGTKLCGFGLYQVYDDFCQTFFQPEIVSYPYTVEYSYTMKENTLYFWPGWNPQKSIPVQHAKYTLIVSDDFNFFYKGTGDIPAPDSVIADESKTYIWEVNDVPVFDEAEFGSFIQISRMRLRFAPAEFSLKNYKFDGRNWESLACGEYALIRDKFDLSLDQAAFIEKIADSSSSQYEICRKLHTEMSRLCRYVAIHIGIGGWVPHESSETFNRGYGDCKDLSVMYVSMLRHVGIDAKYALLTTRVLGGIDPEFPAITGLNHAILMAVADGDTVWIDPTWQYSQAGDLPWPDENVYALIVDAGSGGIVRTDSSEAEENSIVRKTEIYFEGDRVFEARIGYTLTGNARDLFLMEMLSEEKPDVEAEIRSGFYRLSGKFIIDSLNWTLPDDNISPVVVNLYGKVRGGVIKTREQTLLDLGFLNRDKSKSGVDLDTYSEPLEFLFPKTFFDTVTVYFPPNYRPEEAPGKLQVFGDFGSYNINSETNKDRISISRKIGNFQYFLMPSRFPEYNEYLNSLSPADNFFIKFNQE